MRIVEPLLGAITVELVQSDLGRDIVGSLIDKESMVAIDIETAGLDFRHDEIGAIQIFDGSSRVYVVRPPYWGCQNLCALIESEKVRKVFHHAMFDLRFLAFKLDLSPSRVCCTKIISKIVAPEASDHSLMNLLNRELGVSIEKGVRKSNWLSGSLTAEQLMYAARDVIFLPKLFRALTIEAKRLRRHRLVIDSFSYIPARVRLDILGANDVFTY